MLKTYIRLLKFVTPYWKHILLSIAATILFALLNGLSVYLSIPLLSTLFNEETAAPAQTSDQGVSNSFLPGFIADAANKVSDVFNSYIFTGDKIDVLLKICILILIAFVLKNLFGYLQAYFLSYVEQHFIKDFRDISFRHLHKLPMSYFKNEQTGKLISKMTNDITVTNSISAVFLNLVREPLTIIVFIGIALSISWKMTLFSLIILPFSLLIIMWVGLEIRKQSTNLQEKMAGITTILEETINGVKIVKAFGMEEHENKKFQSETDKYSKIVLKLVRIKNISSPSTEVISVFVAVMILYYGGNLIFTTHELNASEFLGFLFAIFQLMPPIKELSTINNRIQESSAAADRIFNILDTEPSIKDSENPVSKSDFNSSIEFDNVSFNYSDSNEPVLKNINFNVKKGEIIALVGSSGSGKTTLVDLIPRFYDPVSGSVLMDGIDLKDIKLSDLRKLLGIVTQETILFNETIKNNIAYGLGDIPEEKIINAAKAANAHNFIMEFSEGYNTQVGDRGTKLSGGQRQRISIARALLKNPPIMIFDEATSALDNESEILVQEAIEFLMKSRTTFVIAHRLSTIRNANRIFVIDSGKIVQEGTHEQLILDNTGIYKKLYDMQFN